MPNPWDVGSARMLEDCGFSALATSSAALGFTKGLPDHVEVLPLGAVLEHVHALVESIILPLNVDFQDGYASTPEGVADNVTQLIAIGVCGLSIEDANGKRDATLLPIEAAAERIRAARSAIDASGHDVLLTGRAENFLHGQTDLDDVVRRLEAYAQAGADVLFAPGLPDAASLQRIVTAAGDKPVNALLNGQNGVSIATARQLGVRRVSVGSAIARVAWAAAIESARALADEDLTPLLRATSFDELNGMF